MIGHDDYFNARSSIGSSLNPPHFSQSVSGVPEVPPSVRLVVRRAVCDAVDGDGEEADDNE